MSPGYSRSRDRRDDDEMSLPEAIFSFVFGDGDPNAAYDEERWRALGRFIQVSQHSVGTHDTCDTACHEDLRKSSRTQVWKGVCEAVERCGAAGPWDHGTPHPYM